MGNGNIVLDLVDKNRKPAPHDNVTTEELDGVLTKAASSIGKLGSRLIKGAGRKGAKIAAAAPGKAKAFSKGARKFGKSVAGFGKKHPKVMKGLKIGGLVAGGAAAGAGAHAVATRRR